MIDSSNNNVSTPTHDLTAAAAATAGGGGSSTARPTAEKGWSASVVGSVCNTTAIACFLVTAYVVVCSRNIHRVVRCGWLPAWLPGCVNAKCRVNRSIFVKEGESETLERHSFLPMAHPKKPTDVPPGIPAPPRGGRPHTGPAVAGGKGLRRAVLHQVRPGTTCS